MTSLNTILRDAVATVPDALFAGMIGTDGLGIDIAFGNGGDALDLDLAELELTAIAAAAGAASDRIGSGRVRALIVEADDATYVAALVTPRYYAILGVPATTDVGRARAAAQALVERIRSEL
jgi:predicted regulator of Ras-like GTPase activity (Roadblock/LC7/MglB family)